MFVVSVTALKGGVGKTTTCLGLASAALTYGLKTLVVDFDPQSDATNGLDVPIVGRTNVVDVLQDMRAETLKEAIQTSPWSALTEGEGRIDVLTGSPSAMNHNGPHPTVRELWKLEELLTKLHNEYDLVIVDTEASLNALTRTAWIASNQVIIIAEASLFGVSATDRTLKAVQEVRHTFTPDLSPARIIINRVRPQSTETQYRIAEMTNMFGDSILAPVLPERTSLQQVQGAVKPVHSWDTPSAKEAAAYFDSALERIVASASSEPPPTAD